MVSLRVVVVVVLFLLALASPAVAQGSQELQRLQSEVGQLHQTHADLIERQEWVEDNVSFSDGQNDQAMAIYEEQKGILEQIKDDNARIRQIWLERLPELSDDDLRAHYAQQQSRRDGLNRQLEDLRDDSSYELSASQRQKGVETEILAANTLMGDTEVEAKHRERQRSPTGTTENFVAFSSSFFWENPLVMLVVVPILLFGAVQALGLLGLGGGALAGVVALPGRVMWWGLRKAFVFAFRRIYGRVVGGRRLRRAINTEGLHTADPDAPGATVRNEPTPWETISSTAGVWHVAGKDYDVPHLAAYAGTGAGKNQHLLNPTASNVIAYRPESVVVNDVKGDMMEEFLEHVPKGVGQWVFSMMEEHDDACGINLIETPKMAATTAAALYPVEGVKNPIFNQGARDLFNALAAHLGYARSNLVELYRVLKDREKLDAIAKRDPRVKSAISGDNKTFAGDVISSARLPLSPLELEHVARVFSPAPGAEQPHFEEKEIVWVCIPQDSESVALLAGAIHDNLVNRATESRRGTYFLLDEAGSCLTIENLAKYLSIGRGLGAYFFLVFQDVAQLEARIGKERAHSTLGNARVQFFGSTGEAATAAYLSGLSGTVRVGRFHYRDAPGLSRSVREAFGEAEADYREEERPAIRPHDLYSVPAGSFYAVEIGKPARPELIHSAPWWTWSMRVLGPPVEPLILGWSEESLRSYEEPAADSGHDVRREHGARAEDATRGVSVEDAEGPPVMETCRGCGKVAPPAAKFCPDCGGRL